MADDRLYGAAAACCIASTGASCCIVMLAQARTAACSVRNVGNSQCFDACQRRRVWAAMVNLWTVGVFVISLTSSVSGYSDGA